MGPSYYYFAICYLYVGVESIGPSMPNNFSITAAPGAGGLRC